MINDIQLFEIPGLKLISFLPFEDKRGTFFESFNIERFRDVGLPTEFVQDNTSISHANVLRGLHIQTSNPQGKLISCLQGKIFDVCIDLRPESPSFKSWVGVYLDSTNRQALYIPEGCAHGFFSITDSVVNYKCTTLYDKGSDGGVNPFDKELNISWPEKMSYTISDKDSNLPSLRDWLLSKGL